MATLQIRSFHLLAAHLCLLLLSTDTAAQGTGGNAGQKIKMITAESPPFVAVKGFVPDLVPYVPLQSPPHKPRGELKGFVPDLMSKIGQMMSSDFQLSVKNKSHMIDLVKNGIIDVAGPLIITAQGEREVDFTKPILSSGIVPVMKKPMRMEAKVSLFWLFRPFSMEIWLLVVFCFVVVSVLLHLTYRFNPRERKGTSSGEEEDFDILGSFMFALSSLTWQGYKRAPRSIGGRVLAAFWWIFVLLLITTYIATLVPFLTTYSGEWPGVPQSMDDLVNDGSYKFGVVHSSPEFKFFENSQIAMYSKVFRRMNDDRSFVSSVEEGIKRSRMDRKFVLLTDSHTAYYFVGRHPCDLMTVGSLLSSWGVGLAVRQGSQLRDRLTRSILALSENGEIQQLYSYWWNDRGQCIDSQISSSHQRKDMMTGVTALTITKFGGVCILLFVGVVISFIVSLAEFFWSRRHNKKTEEAKKGEGSVMIDASAETAQV